MTLEEAKERVSKLANQINHYNDQFFQKNRSLISDYTYDHLLRQLIELEKQYPELKKSDSPTNLIGERTTSGFNTRTHRERMGSLSNTYCRTQVKSYIERIQKLLPEASPTFCCEKKLDGVALSIFYRECRLKYIITRGNGIVGDDVTASYTLISGIPKKLTSSNGCALPPQEVEVRGEVFMTNKNFELLNKKQKESGLPLFANSRNIVSGTLKTLDINKVLDRRLSFLPYTLLGKGISLPTQFSRINLLGNWGFDIVDNIQEVNDLSGIFNYIDKIEKKRNKLPMIIDGIVIKVNEISYQQKLGSTTKSPRWAIAYKYAPEKKLAKLKNIHYQVGRSGVITPVAELDSTLIAGSMIKRASLYNMRELEALDLRNGDSVWLTKGGDVIPKIIGVSLEKREKNSTLIIGIKNCPDCNTELYSTKDHIHTFCPNHKKCRPQLKGKLIHFVSRHAMNIKHIGSGVIDILFKEGLVRQPADLYRLKKEELVALEGFRDKSVSNILTSIEKSKTQPFKLLLFALGIPHVGITVASKLVKKFNTLDKLINATNEELLSIPDIGEQVVKSLHSYFNAQDEQQHISKLKSSGLIFSSNEKEKSSREDSPFYNKTVVISGTFSSFSRKDLQDKLEELGAHLRSSISSKTNYFIRGESASNNKVEKAQALKIKYISERELIKLLDIGM